MILKELLGTDEPKMKSHCVFPPAGAILHLSRLDAGYKKMLPWRRSKFVLVEKESKWEGKSLVAGLTYSSLISSLVRGCPHLLPECSFHRIGGIFRTKRQKVQLTREDPTYTVWYLGSAVTLSAKGEGCTDEAVGKIWARSEGGGSSNKMRLTVGPHGIRMSQPEERSKKNGHMYLLSRITYCGADSGRPRILAWVYRHQVRNKAVVLRCHAALVSKPEKAKAIASLLGQNSTSAFNEFKRLKRQDDDRHRQQQLLGDAIVPLVPLRKLLNRHCPYRSKSTPRLSSIPEDVVGEEAAEETGEGAGEQLGRSTSLVGASELRGWKAIGRPGNSDGIGAHQRPLAGNTEVTMARLLSGQCTDSHSPQPSSV